MSNLPTVEELRNMEIVGYWDSEFYRGVSFGSAISVRFEDVAARVGIEVKPNPAFEFDDRSVFDVGD